LELWRQRGKYSPDIEDIVYLYLFPFPFPLPFLSPSGRKDNQLSRQAEDMIDKWSMIGDDCWWWSGLRSLSLDVWRHQRGINCTARSGWAAGFNGPGKAEHLREGESFMVFLCKFPRTFAYAQNSMDPPFALDDIYKEISCGPEWQGNGKAGNDVNLNMCSSHKAAKCIKYWYSLFYGPLYDDDKTVAQFSKDLSTLRKCKTMPRLFVIATEGCLMN